MDGILPRPYDALPQDARKPLTRQSDSKTAKQQNRRRQPGAFAEPSSAYRTPSRRRLGPPTAPRPLQHGRIIVSFQDGSFIALIAGILLRRRAKRIVAGWRAVRPA
jgi:hypothetical protein